jgi:hypothetical protein
MHQRLSPAGVMRKHRTTTPCGIERVLSRLRVILFQFSLRGKHESTNGEDQCGGPDQCHRCARNGLACRGPAREKTEDDTRTRKRIRRPKCAEEWLAGLHPSGRWNTHSRGTHIRTRAQPLHTRTSTDTHTHLGARMHTETACVRALNAHGAPATRADVCACACASACVRLWVRDRQTSVGGCISV